MSRIQFYKKGLQDGVPISLGYLSVSFTFGLMCTENGLPVWVPLLISMTNLTSAGQFAGTEILIMGGTYIELAATTFIINIRYLLMSISLSQRISPAMGLLKRLALSFGITDEIYAVAMQQKKAFGASYFLGLMTLPYLGWAGGTLLGAGASSLLPESLRSALGVVIYGMFLAIIIPPARKLRPITIVVAMSAVLSCLMRWLPPFQRLGSGWIIILSAGAACAFCAKRYPVDPPQDEEDQS